MDYSFQVRLSYIGEADSDFGQLLQISWLHIGCEFSIASWEEAVQVWLQYIGLKQELKYQKNLAPWYDPHNLTLFVPVR